MQQKTGDYINELVALEGETLHFTQKLYTETLHRNTFRIQTIGM